MIKEVSRSQSSGGRRGSRLSMAVAVCSAHLVLFGATAAQLTTHIDTAPGQATAGARARIASLSNDIDGIIDDRSFSDASWGISVVSCETGEVLYEHEAGRSRQFASNGKLLTTAAALAVLGPDHRFGTELYLGDVVGDGPPGEDLVVRPLGDPSMSLSFATDPRTILGAWCSLLDSLGIKRLRNIIVDATRYDDVPFGPGWAWDDEPFGFNAQISAAAIYDNAVEIRVAPGEAIGSPVRIDVEPSTAYVSLQVNARSGPGDGAGTIDIHRDRGSDIVTVSGSLAIGSEPYVEHVSIDDPPEFFGTVLVEELARHGIDVLGNVVDAADIKRPLPYSSMRRIAVRRSEPLRSLIQPINKLSLNLAAEMITKEMGYEDSGIGSTVAGVDVIRRYAASLGLDAERAKIVDGSGLSRLNAFSASDMTHVLRSAWRSSWGTDFRLSLSVAGRDGTLAGRMKGSLAEGNALGKTGYLNGVRALSGYVRTRDGEWLAFSIATNNYSVPTSVVNTAQDLIVMRLASFSRRNL